MFKDFLLVSLGSFFGGGARFALSKVVQSLTAVAFPLGTMTVNVLGCLLIGFLSGLTYGGTWLTPSTKLILTTGFCGGFTTFSTFMNESDSLLKDGNYAFAALYIFGSLALGLAATVVGHQLAKAF